MKPLLPLPSLSQGYVLVTPKGSIMGHTYRPTADAAIASVFDLTRPADRAMFEGDGYTVQFVYARIFAPVYFPSTSDPKDDQP